MFYAIIKMVIVMKKNSIPICYVTNNNYFYMMYISIYTLISNTKEIIIIYIFHNNVSNKKLNLLKKIQKEHVKFCFHNISKELNRYITSSYITKEAYFRLYLSTKLQNKYNKIIYLDCDTIINNDIKKLYNININKYPLAAVLDKDIDPEYINHLKIDNYFNSGVLLINTHLYLQDSNQINECLDIIKHNKNLRFHDQDILNIKYKDNFLKIDNCFNYQVKLKNNDDITNVFNQYIIHYYGPIKPHLCFKKTNATTLYWNYAIHTPVYKDLKKERIKYILYKKHNKYFKKIYDTINNIILRRKL